MGNAYPPPRNQRPYSGSSFDRDDEDSDMDSDPDPAMVSLLEENARLRALVVQLSDLVLKNVVDQG